MPSTSALTGSLAEVALGSMVNGTRRRHRWTAPGEARVFSPPGAAVGSLPWWWCSLPGLIVGDGLLSLPRLKICVATGSGLARDAVRRRDGRRLRMPLLLVPQRGLVEDRLDAWSLDHAERSARHRPWHNTRPVRLPNKIGIPSCNYCTYPSPPCRARPGGLCQSGWHPRARDCRICRPLQPPGARLAVSCLCSAPEAETSTEQICRAAGAAAHPCCQMKGTGMCSGLIALTPSTWTQGGTAAFQIAFCIGTPA